MSGRAAPLAAPPVEHLSAELTTLVRGLKDLHLAIVARSGHRLEMATAILLARLEDLAPARLSTVASALCVDLSTVSRQVPQLEREGWVVRTTDPGDGRAQLIDLTDDGRSVLASIRTIKVDVLSRLLPDWSAAELEAFAGQLARFNAALAARRTEALACPAAPTTPQERA